MTRLPPPTVWAAAVALAGPPLASVCFLVRHVATLDQLGMLVVPGVWLGFAGVIAGRLLLGRGGFVGGVGLLTFLGLCVGAMGLGIALGGDYRSLPPLAVPLAYLFATGYLLWWPETRRWVGRMPPLPEDDE